MLAESIEDGSEANGPWGLVIFFRRWLTEVLERSGTQILDVAVAITFGEKLDWLVQERHFRGSAIQGHGKALSSFQAKLIVKRQT